MAKSEEEKAVLKKEKEAAKKVLKNKKAAEKLNKELVIFVICLVALFLMYEFGFVHPTLWNSFVANFFTPIFKNFGFIK